MNKRLQGLLLITGLSVLLLAPRFTYATPREAINYNVVSSTKSIQIDKYVLTSNISNTNYIIVNTATNEKISSVHEVIGGVSTPLSASQAVEKLNSMSVVNEKSELLKGNNKMHLTNPYGDYVFARKSEPLLHLGSPIKLSRDVEALDNDSMISMDSSRHHTISTLYSVSSKFEKKLIVNGSSMPSTWGQNAVVSLLNNHTVPKGTTCAVYFRPYVYELKGNIHTVYMSGAMSSKEVVSISPKKSASNICDGLEYIIIKDI